MAYREQLISMTAANSQPSVLLQPNIALTCGLAAGLLDLRPSSQVYTSTCCFVHVRRWDPSVQATCICPRVCRLSSKSRCQQAKQHKLMIYSLLTFTAEHVHSAKNPAACQPDVKQSCQLADAAAASSRQPVWADGSHLLTGVEQQVEV